MPRLTKDDLLTRTYLGSGEESAAETWARWTREQPGLDPERKKKRKAQKRARKRNR